MSFTWIPFYKELAGKLLNYRDHQNELIDIVKKISEKNIPTIKLIDKGENGNVELSEIDPFTFFANINRRINFDNKIKICEIIKESLKLRAEVPKDFAGIPVVDPQKSWFFSFKKDREEDIKNLWNLFKQTVSGEVDNDLFRKVCDINDDGVGKITMGMFWVNPENFLPLGKNTVKFLKTNGITVNKDTIKNDFSKYYTELLNKVRYKFKGKKFYEISFEAWNEKK